MNLWKQELTISNKTIGHIKIKRGILQADSLSPLLFVMSLIPVTAILNKT